MPNLALNAVYGRVSQCALVLEDEPVGEDSRLYFESFFDSLDESYSSNGYRKIGGNRMPQPAFVTYQGGDWGPINIDLMFRAGTDVSPNVETQLFDPDTDQAPDFEKMIIDMERKVDWCLALQFPLSRSIGAATTRSLAKAGNNTDRSTIFEITKAIAKLQRSDPPIVLMILGSWRVIRGYIQSATVKWGPPWHPTTVRPLGATVRMSLQPVMAEYPTWKTIRNRAGTSAYTVNPDFSTLGRGVAAAGLKKLSTAERLARDAIKQNEIAAIEAKKIAQQRRDAARSVRATGAAAGSPSAVGTGIADFSGRSDLIPV